MAEERRKIEMEPIPKYGNHMTLKEFISHVESGCFIDFDGQGYYATRTKISDKLILPSHITGRQQRLSMKTGEIRIVKIKKKIDRKFSHVVWFNN